MARTERAADDPTTRREAIIGAGAAVVLAAGTVAAARGGAGMQRGATPENAAAPSPPRAAPAVEATPRPRADTSTFQPVGTTSSLGASQLSTTATAAHVARRLTYGPTPALLAELSASGADSWFAVQLRPDSIDDSDVQRRLDRMSPLAIDPGSLFPGSAGPVQEIGVMPLIDAANHTTAGAYDLLRSIDQSLGPSSMQMIEQMLAELRFATALRAVYSRRQVYELLVDFWTNHFNVWPGKSSLVSAYLPIADRECVRPHALGRFADLLRASASNPAMLVYLDNYVSTSRSPNENYGRELLELHTVGIAAGYSERDVRDAARTFTGWTIDPRNGRFHFEPSWHDEGSKQVMGWVTTGASGPQGMTEGVQLLEYLARHPATAHHIATKLIKRFVDDAAPVDLVASSARVYLDADTAIAPVLQHIYASDAFWSSSRSKLRRPYDFLMAALRATGAEIDPSPHDGGARNGLDDLLTSLGQRLFDAAAPIGYPEAHSGWLGAGLLPRWYAAGRLARDEIVGITIDRSSLLGSTPATVGDLVDQVLVRLHGDSVAPDRRAAVLAGLGARERDPLGGALSTLFPTVLELGLDAQEMNLR